MEGEADALFKRSHNAQELRLVPLLDDDSKSKWLARGEVAKRNGADRVADLDREGSEKGTTSGEKFYRAS
jgi:hypothetical protein